MKRFLSLVLSALFVFQLGNASCDAGSQWDKRKVICADIYGKSVQPQGLIVPYIPQQQPAAPENGDQSSQTLETQRESGFKNGSEKKSVLSNVLYILLPVASLGIGILTFILNFSSTVLGLIKDAFSGLMSIFNRNNKSSQTKKDDNEKDDNEKDDKKCQRGDCCEEIMIALGTMQGMMSDAINIGTSNFDLSRIRQNQEMDSIWKTLVGNLVGKIKGYFGFGS